MKVTHSHYHPLSDSLAVINVDNLCTFTNVFSPTYINMYIYKLYRSIYYFALILSLSNTCCGL